MAITAKDALGVKDDDVEQSNFTFTFYSGFYLTGDSLAIAPTDAGNYCFDVAYAGSANHKPVASAVFHFTINPKQLQT